MKKAEGVVTNFFTDVLIVGGGIGGLAAAIRIRELSPELVRQTRVPAFSGLLHPATT
jgi:succinate dehydrogenase/fumarate reductase flavoprotein subunit